MTGNDVIAYHQGELSYHVDKTKTCPYLHLSSEWDYWHQGWSEAMRKYDTDEWKYLRGFSITKVDYV